MLQPASLSRLPKANTKPPEAMTPIPQRQVSARQVKKEASDPTPLRQSVGPEGQLLPVASPEIMEEPLEDESLVMDSRRRKTSGGSGSGGSGGGSIGSMTESGSSGSLHGRTSLPPGVLHDPQRNVSTASSISQLGLGVAPPPKGRPMPNHPPARSGTFPSPSTLIDPLLTRGDPQPIRPNFMSRTVSTASQTNGLNHKASVSTLSSLNPLRRNHSFRGPGASTTSLGVNGPAGSGHRKGITPGRRLKLHTCTWDYDLQHALRIPLGKPIPIPLTSGSFTSKGPRTPAAPLLGAGPLSDSGIRLIVEQLPTPAATSTQPANGANKDSLGSMTQAVHHIDYANGNPSELGGGKASRGMTTDGEKAVFGMVDIDLAAFAGKGRTTRRFLLKGSRTNATIKVSEVLRDLSRGVSVFDNRR